MNQAVYAGADKLRIPSGWDCFQFNGILYERFENASGAVSYFATAAIVRKQTCES